MLWRAALSVFFGLAGVGLLREVVREITDRRKKRATTPLLSARVVDLAKEPHAFRGRRGGYRTVDLYYPIVEFTPPGEAPRIQRLSVGRNDARHSPIGSRMGVLWDPEKRVALETSFFALWAPVLGVVAFALACFAVAAAVWYA